MVARRLGKTKKRKKVFARAIRTSWEGCPTKSFMDFKDYARVDVDKKHIIKTLKSFIKANFPKEKEVMLACPDWAFAPKYHIAAAIEWEKLGHALPDAWNKKHHDRFFESLKNRGSEILENQEDETPVAKKTPQDIIKEKIDDFIANVDEVIDAYHTDRVKGVRYNVDMHNLAMEYDIYKELEAVSAANNLAKGVYDHYLPYKQELEELVNEKPEDLDEAYSHMGGYQRKRYLKFITQILDDIEKYMFSKKAVRKTRKPKVKTADKQIQWLKYLAKDTEYKLVSIQPEKIIGAKRLYTFSPRDRAITEYISNSDKGFEIKGTTLQNVDLENSRVTRLRKPNEFLPTVMKKSPIAVNKAWDKLTTKTNKPNARINKYTLLLKVLDR